MQKVDEACILGSGQVAMSKVFKVAFVTVLFFVGIVAGLLGWIVLAHTWWRVQRGLYGDSGVP